MFEFLHDTGRHQRHPVRQLRDLQEYVANLLKTRATFTLGDCPINDHAHLDKYLVIAGSWRVPAHLESERGIRAVNPNYIHKSEYSDAVSICECGAATTATNGSIDECRLSSCNSLYRSEVTTDVWKRRAAIIEEALALGQSTAYLADRLDLSGHRNVSNVCERLNIDSDRLRKHAKRERQELIADLSPEFSTSTLATALDLGESTIQKWRRASV